MAARRGKGQRAAPAAGRLRRPRWSGLRSAYAGRRAPLGPEEEEEEGEGGEALRYPAPLGFSLLPSPPARPRCCAAPRERHLKWRPLPPRAARRYQAEGANQRRGRGAREKPCEGGGGAGGAPPGATGTRAQLRGEGRGDGFFAQLRRRLVVRSRAEHGLSRRAPLRQELKPRWSHLNMLLVLFLHQKNNNK